MAIFWYSVTRVVGVVVVAAILVQNLLYLLHQGQKLLDSPSSLSAKMRLTGKCLIGRFSFHIVFVVVVVFCINTALKSATTKTVLLQPYLKWFDEPSDLLSDRMGWLVVGLRFEWCSLVWRLIDFFEAAAAPRVTCVITWCRRYDQRCEFMLTLATKSWPSLRLLLQLQLLSKQQLLAMAQQIFC